MELRRSTQLLEQRLCDELESLNALDEGEGITEQTRAEILKNIESINKMLQEAYKNEVEREKLEQQAAFEEQRRFEARRAFITDTVLRSAGVVTQGVNTGIYGGLTIGMFKAEYENDKIIASKTSNILLNSKFK